VLLIIECTQHMNEAQVVMLALQDLYGFETVVLTPVDFGVPASRPRKVVVGCLKSAGGFTHSIKDPVYGVCRFFKHLSMNGDGMFMAPDSSITEYMREVASANKVPFELVKTAGMDEALSAGKNMRRELYEQKVVKEKEDTMLFVFSLLSP
jgi:site-specific DNA-cytosine methylase